MTWLPQYPRRIKARRPDGHTPRAPRWSATYDRPFTAITADYIAIQISDENDPAVAQFVELAEQSAAAGTDCPAAYEIVTTAFPAGSTDVVFIGYWTDPTSHGRWSRTSALMAWFRELKPKEIYFGAWRETIEVPLDRVETVYSAPERRFGFAACPGIELGSITTNGYYGAARDRFPLSAIDELEAPARYERRAPAPSRGTRLRASIGLNATAIRSGQYWAEATGSQLEDYEQELEPKMLDGMKHLSSHDDETGTLSLRILRGGTPNPAQKRRETSVVAYFRSLADLEQWAANHATHAAIYEHAIAKNRQYGDARTVTTWHEVFLLPEGTHFEYVNCDPSTGVLAFAESLWEAVDA